MATILPFVLSKIDFDDEAFRTPDSLPWSVKSLRSALLLKRQRRASAIRFACAVPD
jgi:hypothetical protein